MYRDFKYTYTPNRTGALVTFQRKLTDAEKERLHEVLAKEGLGGGTTVRVHDYDADVGGPVWYIP